MHIIDDIERRWAARSAPGRCDAVLTALHLDISPLSLCALGSTTYPRTRQHRSVLLDRQAGCPESGARQIYSTTAAGGAAGFIDGERITAELIWDPRWQRDCYFLWVRCASSGTVLWEGCRRAICPTGMYRLHRNGAACNDNVAKLIIT